jgi:hypothetical protein
MGAAAALRILTLAMVFMGPRNQVRVKPWPRSWILIAVMSLLPLVLGQALKHLLKK